MSWLPALGCWQILSPEPLCGCLRGLPPGTHSSGHLPFAVRELGVMIFFWFKFVFHPELYLPFLATPGVSLGQDLTSNGFLIGGRHPAHCYSILGCRPPTQPPSLPWAIGRAQHLSFFRLLKWESQPGFWGLLPHATPTRPSM